MRKMVLIVVLICLAILGVNHKVQAAPGWVLCTVTGTGIGSTKSYCYLSFTSGQTTYTANGTFDPTHYKELLAITLTAMASSQKVNAYFDSAAVIAGNPWVTIQWLNLSNQQ